MCSAHDRTFPLSFVFAVIPYRRVSEVDLLSIIVSRDSLYWCQKLDETELTFHEGSILISLVIEPCKGRIFLYETF